jgi:PKD repeat protein
MNFKVWALLGLCLALFLSKAAAVDIYTWGPGTITPDLDGKNLVEGRIYTITAHPAPGYVLRYWDVNNHYAPITLSIQIVQLGGDLYVKNGTNYEASYGYVQANFFLNPFLARTYVSLNADNRPEYLVLNLSRNGAYTAKLTFRGSDYSLSGKFLAVGEVFAPLRLDSNTVASVHMIVQSSDITVELASENGAVPLTRFTCKPLISLSGNDIGTAVAGKYTMQLMGYSGNIPNADGFATVNVSPSGIVKAIGKLPDGTPFTMGTGVSQGKDLRFPLIFSDKKKSECVAGWVDFYFDIWQNWMELTSLTKWEKGKRADDAVYPDGFLGALSIDGRKYFPPKAHQRVLESTNYLFRFDGGSLPIHFKTPMELGVENKFVGSNGFRLSCAIQSQSGVFQGTVVPPGETKAIPFEGVVLQNVEYGSGFFVFSNRTGHVKIDSPVPPLIVEIGNCPTNIIAAVPTTFETVLSGNVSEFFWDFGDGTRVTNLYGPTHSWPLLGNYTVSLTAFDEDHTNGLTDVCPIEVRVPPLAVGITSGPEYLTPGLPKDFRALISGTFSSYFWSFGDGAIAGNTASVTHSWAETGDYPVILRAFNAYLPGGVAATSIVHVVEETTHYVSLANTNPVSPYLTWETAATKIQDAIDVAMSSGVLVSNGVYETGGRSVKSRMITNRIAVTKPIVVQSVNGPAATIIKGKWADDQPGSQLGLNGARGAYLTNGAALIGFTLTNGATAGNFGSPEDNFGGGAWCESNDCLISNCVFVGNNAYMGGGVYSGTLAACTISNNFAYWEAGGADHAILSNCVFDGNRVNIAGGAACAYSSLNECMLLRNWSSSDAGGALHSTLEQCVLMGNHAENWGGGLGDSTANHCTLLFNSAKTGGGAVSSVLNSCLVASNTASVSYGGVANWIMNNCTLIGNSSSSIGGGGGIYVNNCIAMYNSAGDNPNYFAPDYMGPVLNNSCTWPMPINGVGNITSVVSRK